MRLASAAFADHCHDGPNWHFVRRQLGSARATWASGEAPPLPLLASELAQLDVHLRDTGHLPVAVTKKYDRTYESLRDDLERSRRRTGERVVQLASPAVEALQAALEPAQPPDETRWRTILRLGREMAAALERPDALVAAFSDLMSCAAEVDVDDALGVFADRLDTFRSTAEVQGHRWATIRDAVTHRLTVRSPDPARQVTAGLFSEGTSLEDVLEHLRQRLAEPLVIRDYAVWVATLAGPRSLDDDHPTVVGNGIAVCGIACPDDVASWLSAVRTAYTDAYLGKGMDVPRDVAELGAPYRFDGEIVQDGPDLWRSMASPPSFVSRVEVQAGSREEAQAQAHAALRAVFSRSDGWMAKDIRPDSWLWTATAGWDSGRSTARDHALGELNAAGIAGRAVESWTSDFATPLDPDDVRLMQARALVNDPDAPAELRLMRGVASLETFFRHNKIFAALERLWLRWAWQLLRRDFDHLLWDIALGWLNPDGPATSDQWAELKRRRDGLRARLHEGHLGYDRGLFDEIVATLDPLDRDSPSWAWVRSFGRRLDDPDALRQMRSAHRAASRRAQRHRNLVAHGWSVSEAVLRSSADFIALQLELAVVARSAARRTGAPSVLAGFGADPDDAWSERTPAELLDAVVASGRRRRDERRR